MSIEEITSVDNEILLKFQTVISLEMSFFLIFLPRILLKTAKLIPI